MHYGALAATLPLIVLLIGIPILMKPAAKVAPVAWLVTVLTAIFVFHFPMKVTLLAALQGGLTGLFPIMYIPFGALVVYNVLKVTGWMDKMQGAMASLTVDRRAQALLIAFGFGAFLEGICGFGAPVAIPASILIGLGYNPMMAALVCLVANTGPVPFGSLAIPTVTLAKTTGLDIMKLSQMTGRFMAPLALIMAFATVYAMSKTKGLKGAIGTILVAGLSFSITQFLVSNFIGADLTSVLAGLACLIATAIYLKFQKHAQPWLFEGDAPANNTPKAFNLKELFLSWLPYLLLAVFVIAVNLPKTKPLFSGAAAGWNWAVFKVQISDPNPGKFYAFTWLQTPGTIMLIAGAIAFPFMGIKYSVMGEQVGKTFKQMIPSFIAVACILSIASVMNLALPIIDLHGGHHGQRHRGPGQPARLSAAESPFRHHRRVPHRQQHFCERPLREPAEAHRPGHGPVGHPHDLCGQRGRFRGEDDLSPEHRHRRRRRGPGRQGRPHHAADDQIHDPLCDPAGPHDLGLCLHVPRARTLIPSD